MSEAILRRAKIGAVKARASIYVSSSSGMTKTDHDQPVPKEFWSGQPLTANWIVGDFSTGMYIGGAFTDCEAVGVKFERSGIEAMPKAVTVNTGQKTPATNSGKGKSSSKNPDGRDRKHDWEGALIAVIAAANSLDGLPEGFGAQAKIVRIMASWFQQHHGEEPASSELKLRAQRIQNELKLTKRSARSL